MHVYSTREYATSLAFLGSPFMIRSLACWGLRRPIDGSDHCDASGVYPFSPLTQQADIGALRSELAEHGLVSFVLVTDALASGTDWIHEAFDVVRPYKTHHVIDFSAGTPRFSKQRRWNIRRAHEKCETRLINLADHMDAWCGLYRNLVERHGMRPEQVFQRSSFEAVAGMDDVIAIGAFANGRLASAHIWIRCQDNIYSHLGASSDEGYRIGASYAVYDHSIAHFADCSLMDLGGVADTGEASQGLDRFKRGFANGTRQKYLCGIVAKEDIYRQLSKGAVPSKAGEAYFPLYRRLKPEGT